MTPLGESQRSKQCSTLSLTICRGDRGSKRGREGRGEWEGERGERRGDWRDSEGVERNKESGGERDRKRVEGGERRRVRARAESNKSKAMRDTE